MDSLKVGDPSPHFVLKDINDNTIFLSNYCGNLRSDSDKSVPHVIILSFFTTWCAPCQSEILILDRFYQDFQEEKVKVFLIAAEEEQNRVRDYIAKKKIVLPVLMDKFLTTSKNFGVMNQKGQLRVPQLYIIDRDGIISYIQKGYRKDADFRKVLINKVGELLN